MHLRSWRLEKFTIKKGSVGAYGYNGEISEFQITSSTEKLNLFKDLWFKKKKMLLLIFQISISTMSDS